MRFSLKWMLAALAFVGVGCVALYNANEAWVTTMLSLTLVVLLAAALGSLYSNSRVFCTGMCVFGGAYLLLAYAPPFLGTVSPFAATDALLNQFYGSLHREIPADPADIYSDVAPEGALFLEPGTTDLVYLTPARKHYRAVGHCLFALFFAIVGGVVGQWLSSKQCNTASEL